MVSKTKDATAKGKLEAKPSPVIVIEPKPKRTKTKPGPQRVSALDAAAVVLKEHGEPMTCGEMVEAMLKRKLWSTSGKTPSATLYSAILRQIETKGKDARFRKVERGKFALAN